MSRVSWYIPGRGSQFALRQHEGAQTSMGGVQEDESHKLRILEEDTLSQLKWPCYSDSETEIPAFLHRHLTPGRFIYM